MRFQPERDEVREKPLPRPFKPFLAALHDIPIGFPGQEFPIRTALITARGAPAHERVIKTLRSWGSFAERAKSYAKVLH